MTLMQPHKNTEPQLHGYCTLARSAIAALTLGLSTPAAATEQIITASDHDRLVQQYGEVNAQTPYQFADNLILKLIEQNSPYAKNRRFDTSAVYKAKVETSLRNGELVYRIYAEHDYQVTLLNREINFQPCWQKNARYCLKVTVNATMEYAEFEPLGEALAKHSRNDGVQVLSGFSQQGMVGQGRLSEARLSKTTASTPDSDNDFLAATIALGKIMERNSLMAMMEHAPDKARLSVGYDKRGPNASIIWSIRPANDHQYAYGVALAGHELHGMKLHELDSQNSTPKLRVDLGGLYQTVIGTRSRHDSHHIENLPSEVLTKYGMSGAVPITMTIMEAGDE